MKLNKKTIDNGLAILFHLIWVGAMMIKIIYLQFTIKINKPPIFEPRNIYMMIASFGTLLIVYALVHMIFYKSRRRALFIINIIVTLVFIADTLYGRYYYNPITVPIFYQLGFMNDVSSSALSLIRIKDLVFLIDFPIYIILSMYLKDKKIVDLSKVAYIITAVGTLALGIILFFNVYSKTNVAAFGYERKYVAQDLGIFYYHYYDVKDFISKEMSRNEKLTDEELDLVKNYYENNTHSDTNKYKDLGKGKNLIIVQLEAIQGFLVDMEYEGQEVMPYFNQLKDESIYFSNYYHQVADGNTSDAEFITNTSLQPAPAGAAYYLYPNNDFYSIGTLLKDSGYDTYAFHGYEPSFWNRTVMYRTLGFDKFYSKEDYVMDEQVGWAIGDKSFYKQSVDYIVSGSKDEPFYGFMVTLSSHHPYDAFNNFDFNVGDFEGKQVGNYVKSAHYVDEAIREFFDYLKEKDLYDDSIIVIYGDHSGLFKDQATDLSKLLNFEYSDVAWEKLQTVPSLIHIPGMENGEVVETIGGNVDMMPTLANIMGFENPFMLGKDLINSRDSYVVKRHGNVITDDYIYIKDLDKVYDHEYNELDKAAYIEELQEYYKELQVSDILLEKNTISKNLED